MHRAHEKQVEARSGIGLNRRTLAALLARFPVLAALARTGAKLLHGRFSAGVVGVVLNERDEILVVEHVFHPEWPWGLPGGWLNRGEAPAMALARELQEETGMEISVRQPLLVDRGQYWRTHLDISFLCRTTSDTISLSPELLSYRWVRPETLPRMLPFHRASVAAALASSELRDTTNEHDAGSAAPRPFSHSGNRRSGDDHHRSHRPGGSAK